MRTLRDSRLRDELGGGGGGGVVVWVPTGSSACVGSVTLLVLLDDEHRARRIALSRPTATVCRPPAASPKKSPGRAWRPRPSRAGLRKQSVQLHAAVLAVHDAVARSPFVKMPLVPSYLTIFSEGLASRETPSHERAAALRRLFPVALATLGPLNSYPFACSAYLPSAKLLCYYGTVIWGPALSMLGGQHALDIVIVPALLWLLGGSRRTPWEASFTSSGRGSHLRSDFAHPWPQSTRR